tara:strand:+ start:14590 stop:14862 length:273 start_codon:yes stop_codon:yes gene_type:complete
VKSEYLGYIAAILTTIAFLPQLIRTFRTKSADDVSFLMLAMFLIGLTFWIFYGWQTKAIPVIMANIVTFILNLSILILKIIFKTEKNSIS